MFEIFFVPKPLKVFRSFQPILQVFCWDCFHRGLISQVFHPAAFGIACFCWPPFVPIQSYAIIRGQDF